MRNKTAIPEYTEQSVPRVKRPTSKRLQEWLDQPEEARLMQVHFKPERLPAFLEEVNKMNQYALMGGVELVEVADQGDTTFVQMRVGSLEAAYKLGQLVERSR